MKYSARHVSYLNNTRSLKKCCKLETKRILILDQIEIEKKNPQKTNTCFTFVATQIEKNYTL